MRWPERCMRRMVDIAASREAVSGCASSENEERKAEISRQRTEIKKLKQQIAEEMRAAGNLCLMGSMTAGAFPWLIFTSALVTVRSPQDIGLWCLIALLAFTFFCGIILAVVAGNCLGNSLIPKGRLIEFHERQAAFRKLVSSSTSVLARRP
jgi:hypothetical protein